MLQNENNKILIEKKINILTFDIEEWFHLLDNKSTKSPSDWSKYEYRLESNMDYIFNLLIDNKLKASFFCLGWVARKFPNIVKKIDKLGFDIGSHSDLHQLVYEQSRSEFRDDLSKSIHSIEDLIGKKIKMYRSPGFSLTNSSEWVFEELISQGIEIDCSLSSVKTFNGGFTNFDCFKPSIIKSKSGELKEFPINTYNFLGKRIIFSGGGYFRFFPYYMIKHMSKKSKYMMTYYHPRDFDTDQPIISDLSLFRKFRAYYGIDGCYDKLDRLVKEFDFLSITQADKAINWDIVERLEI